MVENPGGLTTVSFTSATLGNPRQMIVVVDDESQKAATAHGLYVYDAWFEPVSPSPEELEPYVGTYYSDDVDYEWVLRITNDRLSMWDRRTWVEFTLTPFAKDVFTVGGRFFTFSRDDQGRVVGFTVRSEALRNLQFVRR